LAERGFFLRQRVARGDEFLLCLLQRFVLNQQI
jgi:hypothetical protein